MKNALRLDLIKARKAAGVSQGYVGKVAGVKQGTVSRFEIGYPVSDENAEALMAAYAKLWTVKGARAPEKPEEKAAKLPKEKKAPKPKRSPSAAAEDDDEPEDSPVIHPPKNRPIFDAERLKAVTRAFVADKDLSIHESGRSGARHIMVPPDDLYEFGQIVLRNAGIRVG